MQYIINNHMEVYMQFTAYYTNTADTTTRTFEGLRLRARGRDKIISNLDHIAHVIGYPGATDDDVLAGVNELLRTITRYECGYSVINAIVQIITTTRNPGKWGRDFLFTIDAIVHTLILNPSNDFKYKVINFDLLESDISGVTNHYDNPLVNKLLDNIINLPTNIVTAIVAGLGYFLDNVYSKFKYHSTDIPKSGNIITHVNYDSLPIGTTSIMVYDKEIKIDINQTLKRIRQHTNNPHGDISINEYIHNLYITKQVECKEVKWLPTKTK